MRFFKTVHSIFFSYEYSDALRLCGVYARLLIRNRLPHACTYSHERLLEYTIEFPDRRAFFGQLTEIFFKRVYPISKSIEPLSIIDCGSNIGITILYFKWLCPRAKIFCFEPNPEAIPFLERNIALNQLSAINVFPYALGKEDGTTFLRVNSLVRGSTSATTMHSGELAEEQGSSVSVSVRRLSDFIIEPVDILKIDVEGAEGEILEDLEERKKFPFIREMYIEYHFDGVSRCYPKEKLLSLLQQNGFQYSFLFSSPPLTAHSKKALRTDIIHAVRKDVSLGVAV